MISDLKVSDEAWERNVGRHVWEIFAFCGQCGRGVIAIFRTAGHSPLSVSLGDMSRCDLVRVLPDPPDMRAPKHTPDNVGRFYRQGMDSFTSGNWDAAGAMFRKTLDTGLKKKFPKIEGKLHVRIQKAAQQNELTQTLADWADQIRLGGNKAVHDNEPFSQKEAGNLQIFTELVLRYLFTLPGTLEKAQETSGTEAN